MTAMVTHGKSEKERLVEAEQILSDKINGMPVSQIMEKYDISKMTVYRRIDAAVDARIAPTVDRHREMMNAAYDETITEALANLAGCRSLIAAATEGEDLQAIERAVALHQKAVDLINRTREHQRKLNGLDLPVMQQVHVTVSTPLDDSIASLVSELDALPAG